MKAARLNGWGEPIQVEDLPQPTPASDEVLVRIRAASVNPVDKAIAAGYLAGYANVPMTMGSDFAGDVLAVGADVESVKLGDAVYGLIVIRGGAFAEYAVVKEDEIALKPQSLDYVYAAAVPLAGLTAWESLFELAQLQDDERILVHGAGGTVGGFAVQLAKNSGAHVIAHCRADRADFVRGLGADEIVYSDSQRFEDNIEDVDVVLDLVGGDWAERSFDVCGPGARYLTTVAIEAPTADESLEIQSIPVATHNSVEGLTILAEEIDAGHLTVVVDRTFPLAEVQEAMAYKTTSEQPNKVVITM